MIFPELTQLMPGDRSEFEGSGHDLLAQGHRALGSSVPFFHGREKSLSDLVGSTVVEMGLKVQQWLLEVSPLRGQTMGRKAKMTLFPLPTSNSSLLDCPSMSWHGCLVCV